MRIRTIKPEFWSHPILCRKPDEVRLCAIGLLNISDDEGYFLAEASLIRSSLWPFDEDSSRARRCLDQLSECLYIELREHPSHGQIGLVVNFTKHQRVDRPRASTLKAYFLDDQSTNVRRSFLSGMEGNGMEQGKEGKGVKGEAKISAAKPSGPTNLIIPASLNSQNFLTAWADWIEFRKSRNKVKNWNKLFQKTLDWLAVHPVATAVAIIDQSLRNGWIGLFDLKIDPRAKPGAAQPGVNHVLINAENWEKQEAHAAKVREERERTARVSAELDRKMRELEEQP